MKLKDGFPVPREGFNGRLIFTEDDVFPKPRGFLSIDRVYPDGFRERVLALEENLVVTMGRRIMSRENGGAVADSGANPAHIQIDDVTHPNFPGVDITAMTQLAITKMIWGTGGHNPLNPTEAIPPLASDEQLAIPLVTPAFKSVVVDYPDTAQTKYTATLEQGEANGQGISEVGLITENFELLFCRKTFGMLTKSSAFAFEFAYTIVW